MATKALYTEMFANACHIGSHKTHWSPKMIDFIHSEQNGIHVFDLVKTASHLEETVKALEEFCKAGNELLIVGTKIQAQQLARDLASESGHHVVASVWVPGLLTNWSTIKRRVKEYNDLVRDIETGKMEQLSKKEKSMAMIRFNRLRKRYEGIKDMRRLPDGILVLDGRYDRLAIEEANRAGTKIFSLLGTTGEPDLCDHFIPGNVNNIKSLTFFVEQLKPVMKKVAREQKARPGLKKKTPEAKAPAKKEEAPKKEEKAEEKKAPVKKEEKTEKKED